MRNLSMQLDAIGSQLAIKKYHSLSEVSDACCASGRGTGVDSWGGDPVDQFLPFTLARPCARLCNIPTNNSGT
jgi:hypothetical protein